MIGKFLTGFKFKPAEKKKPKVSTNIKRKSNKKFYCVCEILNDEYVAKVYEKLEANVVVTTIMPFSENSKNLKGKLIVFTKYKINNQIAAIYRNIQEATHFPGVDTQYTPFRKRWIYKGYVIIKDGKEYFDITETCGNFSSCNYLLGIVENDEEEENEEKEET